MKWFRNVKWFGLIVVSSLSLVGQPISQDQIDERADEKRPNVLFIMVDDQSAFDLGLYNPNSELETPNIDRLAREGMTLDAAYHMGSFSGAVCSPSRHMVMTGRTLWHLPIGPGKTSCPENCEQFSMAAVFNNAGYDTMRTCKKGNSYPAANRQFSVVKDASKRGGTADTGSAWHGKQVLDYLEQRQNAKDEDPFLIYFGFSHPHDVRDGTPELLKKYGATNHTDKERVPPENPNQPRLPDNYLPQHPFPIGHPRLRDEVNVSGVWKRRDETTMRNELGRQFACSENIDLQIGKVLDKLESMGELENTYVIYTSDHGIAIGRHGLQGKQNLYEHSWRVPMVVKGPGIEPGTRADGNVYLLDSLATICDLVGIDPPASQEGKSFKAVLEGKESTIRDVLYGAYCGGTKPGIRSVRKGEWKLIKYDVLDGDVRETQLFDLSNNPHEFLGEHARKENPRATDLAEVPEYAEKLAEMESLLLEEMRRLDDPYRFWNQESKDPTPK